jgi:NhaP-type Na+/H+ or K+/H+ antiporter
MPAEGIGVQMLMASLFLLFVFTLAYTMVARRLASTAVTAPMLFIGFGLLLSQTGWMPQGEAEEILHLLAEVALILVLFFDAAQTDLRALRRQHTWPVRMLLIGLPLAILLGTFGAWLVLPAWPIVALFLLASILAPTDAALGQAVVTNAIVPMRARRALTVESGLNDGIALLAVLLFASLTAEEMVQNGVDWLLFGLKQMTLGPLVGAAAGFSGGIILLQAKKYDLTSDIYEGLGALALAGTAYVGADLVGGNGFIAAFVAGLCFGSVVKASCKFVFEFTESEGQLLTLGAFFLLGLTLVPGAIASLSLEMLGLILMSLLVVRPLAIWVSLLGTDASTTTRLFFGWFGPRGLATALFALLVVGQSEHQYSELIMTIAINTVWISALLHGLSAAPGARWYAARIAARGVCPEVRPVDISAKPLVTR